ncbi:hypothetical protein GOBAR_AA31797 [Gossypium barbadense]|uniref:Exocyst complex component Sec3 C-terminal domain-containing protein n=1 Tax=Gossypium barbadense TaxID=3634 RepID=A0A2P5WCT2_GOSBA|nr:hypothetical protein GOBAR_AA31797 [Gossypium barbadense]
MDEWLGIFNVKLRHMREDIQSIETRNNKLEVQSVNNKALIAELDKLVERFRFPSEYASCLTGSQFDEASLPQYVEACEWLTNALHGLEVREKRAELGILKATFVRKASEFLRICFATSVDFMINDKNYFSQRGQLKKPDHADLRYKCRTYARLLQHLKILDGNCLGPLRKAYCSSLNSLLRREAHEFANELRASTKVSKTPNTWMETFTSGNQSANNADTSAVSDAYAKMLTIFVPLLVDEGSRPVHDNDSKAGKNSPDLLALNEALQDLLDGIQEDFYVLVDWAYKIDPLRCISLHGVTERYLSGQKSDAARFVRVLLGDLESKISMQFSRFVDEACHQIERSERNARQTGVLPYIPRFATLATRMEQYIQGQSRDLVDLAYTKFVSIMFVTLERLSQVEPKYAEIFLLENYAAFQNRSGSSCLILFLLPTGYNISLVSLMAILLPLHSCYSLYDLANVVPTLAKFYHQASEAYEQACQRHLSMIIYFQFERLFQFAKKIEDLMFTISPEEISIMFVTLERLSQVEPKYTEIFLLENYAAFQNIPFQLGLSKMDLRKTLKSSLTGVDKSIAAMYKKLQKNLTCEELLPSLWDKCKLLMKCAEKEHYKNPGGLSG